MAKRVGRGRGETAALAPVERVQGRILLIRGQRVIVDADLAGLYGVTTKRLNQQVRRNSERFPEDFMFQLSWEETANLRLQIATLRLPAGDEGSRSQNATLKPVGGGRDSRLQIATLSGANEAALRSQSATLKHGRHVKYRPYVFTEHGAIMAANVLNSAEAIRASVFVVRAFVQLRQLLGTHQQLAAKLEELERRLQDHDEQIVALFEAIRELMEEPEEEGRPPIGFATELGGGGGGRGGHRL